MADTRLTINLDLDKTAAAAASSQFFSELRKQQKQAVAEAVAAERAKTDALRKESRQRLQEERAAAKEMAALARDQQKRATDALKAEISAYRAAAKEQVDIAREAARAQATFQRELTQERAKATRAAKDALAEENRLLKDAQAFRAKLAARRKGDATEEVKGNAAVADSVGVIAGKYVGLAGAAGMVREIGAAWGDVIDKQREAIAQFNQIAKESRVGAGVAGKAPEAYAASTLKLSAESGLGFRQADELSRQFEGTVPIGFQKGNITREVADELKSKGAQMGARLGGDQATRGELLGILPQFSKIGSAQEGLGKAEAIRQALTEGRGDDSPLTKALLNVAGTMTREDGGMVGSLEENAALVGTTSLAGGPGMADTRALQISRAVRGTTGKQAKALESEFGIKVGSKEGLEERLGKIIPKLREIGKATNVQDYLRDTLDLPEENAQALVEMMPNYEVFQKRAAAARETAKTGGAKVAAENEAFQKTATGRTMVAEAQGEAGRYLEGEKRKDFGAMTAKEQALLDSGATNWMVGLQGKVRGAMSYVMPSFGTQAEAYADSDLEKRLRDEKVADPFGGITGGLRAMVTSPADRGTERMKALEAAGKDPYKDLDKQIDDKVTDRLDKLIKLTEDGNKQRADGNKVNLDSGAPTLNKARP